MDDIELETRSMVDEGAELKHGVTCLRSRPIENSLVYIRIFDVNSVVKKFEKIVLT